MRPVLHPDVWYGRQDRQSHPARPTGHPRLDRELPGGGWPAAGLTELLLSRPGLGELSLLLPLLAAITGHGHGVVLVDPPWIPYPPAMRGHGIELRHVLLVRTGNAAEAMWACEQALRGARDGAVLAWPRGCAFAQLRRLQLAARANRQAGFLFRPVSAAGTASPAALRIHLEAGGHGLCMTLLKGRGVRPGTRLRLPRQHPSPGPSPACPDASARDAIRPLPVVDSGTRPGVSSARH